MLEDKPTGQHGRITMEYGIGQKNNAVSIKQDHILNNVRWGGAGPVELIIFKSIC